MTVLLGKTAPAPKITGAVAPPILPPPKPSGAAKEAATLAPVKGGPGYKAPKPNAPAANPFAPPVKPPKYGLTLPGSKLKAPTTTNAQLKTAMAAQKQAISAKATTAKTNAIVKALTNGVAAPQLAKPEEAGIVSRIPIGQIAALPKTMGEGALESAFAVAHDAEHPVQTVEHPLQSQTFGLAKSMVQNDPILKTIETGNTKYLNQNALGAVLDTTMVGGAAGKLADIGALGDTAASAFERESVRVPGTNTVQIRPRLSTNPIFHAGQRITDARAGADLKTGNLDMNWTRYLTNPIHAIRHDPEANPQELSALNQRVDEDQHTADTNMTHGQQANLDSLKTAKKIVGKNNAVGQDLVGHFEQQLPDNPAVARTMMQKNLDLWQASLAKHEAAAGTKATGHLEPNEAANLEQNIAAMEQGLKMQPAELQKVIDAAKVRQDFQKSDVESGRIDQALGTSAQAERRGVVPYAIQNMGAEHTDNLADRGIKILSDAGVAHKDVGHQLSEAQQEFQLANKGTHPELKPLLRGINLTKRTLERAKGAKDAAKVDALRQLRDEQVNDFKTNRNTLRAKTAANVERLKNEQAALAGKQRYLKGWVVPTEHIPTAEALRQSLAADEPIHGLSPLGQDYEPLDTSKALEHAKANGITPGYLSGTHPDEEALSRFKRGIGSAGRGGSGKSYLGDSFVRGTFNGTLEGSGRSALSGLRAINKAQNYDRQLRDFGLNDPETGELHTFPTGKQGESDATAMAKAFEDAHPGQPLKVVARYPDKNGNVGAIDKLQGVDEDPSQRLALMHGNALDRFEKHAEAKKSVAGLGALNRLWRGGVLPFSANYIQAVPQEGILRTAMNGINPLRTLPGVGTHLLAPKNFNDLMNGLKASAEDERLDPATRAAYREQHDFLHGLSGGGTMFGSQDQELRDAMMNPINRDPKKAAALGRKIEQFVYKPGQWNLKNMHKLENVQARAVLNDWTTKAAKTAGSVEDLAKALGDGKNGANLAATATHHMNDVLGNYVHRSPTEQMLIRNYTPFLPWLKNAIRFVYVTLPRDHPVMASWLAKVGQTQAGAWQQEHKNLAPFLSTEFLGTKYGNPLETVGGMDPLRNTPFGVGESSPLSTAAGIFEPSLSGLIYGAQGLNGFGEPVPTSTYGQDVKGGSTAALKQTASNEVSSIPYIGTILHAIEGANGHTAKDAVLSHNHALAAIENALGGSLLPKNYGVYSQGGTTSSSSGGLSGSGGLTGTGGLSGSSGLSGSGGGL